MPRPEKSQPTRASGQHYLLNIHTLASDAAQRDAAEAAARAGLADFRKIARQVFKDNANAQSNVGVTGRVPDDEEKFLTFATAAYESALSHSTYLTALSRRGYAQAALQAEQAKAAVRATTLRDEAKSLDAWWAEFRAVAQVVLKDRPDLLGLLGL